MCPQTLFVVMRSKDIYSHSRRKKKPKTLQFCSCFKEELKQVKSGNTGMVFKSKKSWEKLC